MGTFVKHRQYDLKTNPGTSKEHHWRHVIPPDIREIFNLLPISIGDTKQNHIMAWLAASGRAHSQSVDYKSWCSILRRSDLTQRDAFNSKCNSFLLLLLLHPLEGVFYANWFCLIPIRRCCLPRCDSGNRAIYLYQYCKWINTICTTSSPWQTCQIQRSRYSGYPQSTDFSPDFRVCSCYQFSDYSVPFQPQ